MARKTTALTLSSSRRLRAGAGDLDPEDGDCGDPAFSGANAVWIVCARCAVIKKRVFLFFTSAPPSC